MIGSIVEGATGSADTLTNGGYFILTADGTSFLEVGDVSNAANTLVTSRIGIRRIGNYEFDNGMLVRGLTGTAAPSSGGMPAPFRAGPGTALPWAVGDTNRRTNERGSVPWRDGGGAQCARVTSVERILAASKRTRRKR